MSPHSSRGSSSREAAPHLSAPRLSTAHTAASPTARFRKPARPLAARYSDPAPRSLRAVEESEFAPRIGERILFTGASGLLGRESVLELLRVGYDVRVLQRGDSGIAALLPDSIRPRFEQVRGDITNEKVVDEAMTGVDGVVHAAAKVSVSGEWADYERINIGGTRVMLQAAVNHSVRTFLYISSPSVAHAGSSIVGDGAGEASPEHARGNYARSKAAAELLGLEAHADQRVIEADNYFEGEHVTRQGLLRNRKHWGKLYNPLRPSWGEPYLDQVKRMASAIQDAACTAYDKGGEGAQAIIVSHQLPIWVTRLGLEGRLLQHDPRTRQCNLASITSLDFKSTDFDHEMPQVSGYSEPASPLYGGVIQLPGS